MYKQRTWSRHTKKNKEDKARAKEEDYKKSEENNDKRQSASLPLPFHPHQLFSTIHPASFV
jgi:hypothetical protein